MALIVPIAGAYSLTLDSDDIGALETGAELQIETKEQVLNQSDQFGQMIYDKIFQGIDVYLQFNALSYTADGIATALSPWAALGQVGVIGRLASNVASELVMTSTTGTPAAASPATLTADLAILAPNANPRLLFNSQLRTVPIRLQFLPYSVTVDEVAVVEHFSTT